MGSREAPAGAAWVRALPPPPLQAALGRSLGLSEPGCHGREVQVTVWMVQAAQAALSTAAAGWHKRVRLQDSEEW